jgi:sugar-phosphatase
MVTAGEAVRGKPAPDPYLLGASRLGVEPADCTVVEDAPAGVASGAAAGCQVVAVSHTHRCVELSAADDCFPDLGVAVRILRALRDPS